MHIFNAGGSARWGPVPFMKKTDGPRGVCALRGPIGNRGEKREKPRGLSLYGGFVRETHGDESAERTVDANVLGAV